MARSTFSARVASATILCVLCALGPLACVGGSDAPDASGTGNPGDDGGAAGAGGSSAGSGGAGAAGSGGRGTCGVDPLVAQAWEANDDACTVQGDLIVCSTYRFRFDGTWQRDTAILDSNGGSSACAVGSWSQTACGVLDLQDCNHAHTQVAWSVSGSGTSAVARLNGKTYSAESPASFEFFAVDDCVPAACADAPKNTYAFVGTWRVSDNNVTVNCSAGLGKPTPGDFLWQKGTTSDLVEQDGPCTWQFDVLGSTFSLPSKQACTDPSTGVTLTYYRYDGALETPTTATVKINLNLAFAASASSPAGSCSLVGTLTLAKVAQ